MNSIIPNKKKKINTNKCKDKINVRYVKLIRILS